MTTMSTEPHEESIKAAVARETARRRRVFITYLSLLALPLAIGGFALAKAPSEMAAVANDVTPVVTERVGAQVSNEVMRQTAPMISATVSREVTSQVEPRFKTAAYSVDALRTSVDANSRQINEVAASARTTADAVTPLRNEQAAIRRELTDAFAQRLSVQQEDFDRKLADQRKLAEKQNAEFRQVVAKEIDSLRELVKSSDAESAKRVATVESRLNRMEKYVAGPHPKHPE